MSRAQVLSALESAMYDDLYEMGVMGVWSVDRMYKACTNKLRKPLLTQTFGCTKGKVFPSQFSQFFMSWC